MAEDKKEDVIIKKEDSNKKVDYVKVTDNLNKQLDKQTVLLKKFKVATAIALFLLVAVVGAWVQLNVTLTVDNSIAVSLASFSVLIVIVVLGVVFGTGVGGEVVRRFKNRLLFNSGRFVNVLYVTKNGVMKEFFKKVDNVTGSFKINDKTYTRNPSLLYRYKKIPTYLHREGNPDPIDPFLKDLTTEFSEAEIDQVMESKNTFDFKTWLSQNALIIFIILCGVVAVGAVGAYFGFMIEQMLREGTYAAVRCVEPSVVLNATSIV